VGEEDRRGLSINLIYTILGDESYFQKTDLSGKINSIVSQSFVDSFHVISLKSLKINNLEV